jgi:hypothetical protein
MITVSEIRNRVNASPENDDELIILQSAVESQWEELTGGKSIAQTGLIEVTEPIADNTRSLWLSLSPITTITTVEESSDAYNWSTALDVSNYVVLGKSRLKRTTGYWSKFVRITYDGGWTNTTTPQSVKLALLAQAQFMFKRLRDDLIEVSSQNFEGGNGVLLSPDLHPLFKLVAKAHTRLHI